MVAGAFGVYAGAPAADFEGRSARQGGRCGDYLCGGASRQFV